MYIMKALLTLLLVISIVPGCLDAGDTVTPEHPRVVEIAKNDLAGRLNISAENIRLVEQERANWSDASLGYPEEGMFYAQVITPGFRIILEAEGRLYEYHSDYERVVGPVQ